MSPLAPLLALDRGDLIWLIVVILFIVVPAIGQLLAKMGQQQQPRGRRLPGRPPGGGAPAGRPPGRAAAGRPPGGLEDEIGEFLRRAAQQRQAAQPAPPPRPAGRPGMAPPAGQQLVEAEVVRQPAVGEGVKQHVGEYLDAEQFRRRADELGEEVARADDEIEQRLHAKFDREVSRLAGRPGESADAPRVEPAEEPEDRPAELPSTAAAGLAAMLSNDVGIRWT